MPKDAELRTGPGKLINFEVTSIQGTAVDLSEIVDFEAYEQEIMVRLGGNPVYEDKLKGITLHGFPCHPFSEKLYGDISTAYEALALWQEWFSKSGEPILFFREYNGCFFCGSEYDIDNETHKPDCIYVRAKALIEGE